MINKDDKIEKIKLLIDFNIKSLNGLFKGCNCIKKIKFTKFKIKDINNMSNMFSGCSSLKEVDFSNVYSNNVVDINTLILQDADNLDAIGAIGIGRTFTYGGAHNIKMYDEDLEFDESNNFSDAKDDPTTLHHFYHKLFKLGDNMNTKTAKKMAVERINFMKEFVNEFLDEWNGKK